MSSMPSSLLSNQGNTTGASVKSEESMSPSLSSRMSETPQVLTLTRSVIALPDIQEILRSTSPLLLSTPMNKVKHLLDTPPGLAPPKHLHLHNAILATPYTSDIRPPAPYILAYGLFTPIETGYPRSLPLNHDYHIFMMHAVSVDPHHQFAYRNHSLFNHAPLIVTLPSLSNNDLYFPLSSMQLEFIEDVISLLKGQHSQRDGLLISHKLLMHQMKFTVNKNADPVYQFPLIKSLFALTVFWFAEEHFPDSDSDEPSHSHYLQRQPVYDNTSSDMDNFLDSDSDSYWDSLSTSETLLSSSSDSPKLSLLELEFKNGKAPGYSPEKYGIELPLSVLNDRELCGYDQTGEPLYHFKGAEKLITTTVDLVLASYPLINHKNDVEFVPPQIPYRQVIFSDDEPQDEHDDGSTLYYCGMLGRCEAFRFHYHWPSLYDPLVNLASTTFELFLLHAHPRAERLPDEPTPNWDSLLFPQKFHKVFPDHTPTSLLESVQATDKKSFNLWAHQI
ncbi:hypothetical protein BDZ97DRAFT_1926382 [Flammula alnicola]|nr:hypothetical protein BDZ97DRAFT_1926382 [Flammula alnicola]